ncbi:hypothetical protein AcV7_000941 [Taiwanofungus camphoratus]|nr:hypothetical protein AcW2_000578 [Antrodia cinnamomea]KAI0961997.1 hypothetical protein AcV7_000941 [Antrodia cinnamomea]
MRTSDRVELRTGKQGQAGLVWERRIPARVLSHWPRSFISSASILSPPCAISCATDRLTCALDWTKTRLLSSEIILGLFMRMFGELPLNTLVISQLPQVLTVVHQYSK